MANKSVTDRLYEWLGLRPDQAPQPKKLAAHAHAQTGDPLAAIWQQLTGPEAQERQRQYVADQDQYEAEELHAATLNHDITLEKHILAAKYGKKYADKWEASVLQKQRQFRQEHGSEALLADIEGTIAGGELLRVGGGLLAGGGKLLGAVPKIGPMIVDATQATGRAIEPAAQATGRFLTRWPVLKAALEAAGISAVQGAGEAGEGHRVEGAEATIPYGLMFGAGLSTTGIVGREIVDNIGVRLGLLDAEKVAQRRLARAQAGRKPRTEYTPRIQELRRKAAVKSSRGGKGITAEEGERIGVGVPIHHTVKSLTPDTDITVAGKIDELHGNRRALAREQYRDLWAQNVKLNDKTMDAFKEPLTREFLRQAENTQVSYSDPDLVGEVMRHKQDFAKIEQYYKDLEDFEARHKAWLDETAAVKEAHEGPSGGWDLSSLSPENRKIAEKQITNYKKGPSRLGRMPPDPTPTLLELGAVKAKPLENIGPEPQLPEPPTISAGTLDLVRSRMVRAADDLMPTAVRQGNRGKARAYQDIAGAFDELLDGVEGLKEARAVQKHFYDRIDALKDMGENIFKMNPRDFSKWIDSFPPETREDARIALREEMEKITDDPTKLNKLEDLFQSSRVHDNMRLILGADENAAFRNSARSSLELGGAKMPRGSEDDLATMGTMGKILWKPVGWTMSLADAASKLTMTQQEAEALLRYTEGDPAAVMDAIEAHPQGALGTTIRNGMTRLLTSYNANVPQPAVSSEESDKPKTELEKAQEQWLKNSATPNMTAAPAPAPTDNNVDFSDLVPKSKSAPAPTDNNVDFSDLVPKSAPATGTPKP
jgi:hypothetical protein